MVDELILHIETSGRYCSVVLTRGGSVLSDLTDIQTYTHSETLAPYVQEVIRSSDVRPADLHAISVSTGPGSYTGLRVGASLAKAMCFALDIPLIAVDTLEAIAIAAITDLAKDALYIPNIDARRMEVYCAAFDQDGYRILPNTSVEVHAGMFDKLLESGNHVVFCGSGTSKSIDVLHDDSITLYDLEVQARHLVPVALRRFVEGKFADVIHFKPEYIKAPNITLSRKAKL